MDPDPIATAKASYARCEANPDFLQGFYRHFFATCPAAETLFARTDFARQIKLLRHAIGLLLAFPSQPREEPTLLTRLAEKHGPRGLNIDPSWYPLFVESLLQSVREHDPGFTPAVGLAWREALRPGITYMQEQR
ncbi:MAG TPA: globin [Gemmatimonadales bacterium]|jgi:hemoglobin-like flavoprotein